MSQRCRVCGWENEAMLRQVYERCGARAWECFIERECQSRLSQSMREWYELRKVQRDQS